MTCINDVMVCALSLSVLHCAFEPWAWFSETKNNKFGICCFSIKHAAFSCKSKDLLALNQDNVSEWRNRSTHGLLFQCVSTIKFQYELSILV